MAKDSNTPTAAPSADEELLSKVKADYTQYFDYIRPYRTKWDKYWKLWNNKRVNKQYYGDTDSFEPMTFQMIESGTDNVYGSRPRFTYLPTRVEQESDTKILNGLLDYSWDKSNVDDKLIPWGREIKITGNGVFFPSWCDGYMDIYHAPIRDCILDTSASKPENMRYAGYRRLDMLENMKKAMRYDPTANKNEGAWIPRYKNLDDISTFTDGGNDKVDKELKDCYAGSTLGGSGKKGQVEVIFMMYKDKFVEVANRETIIAEFDNPYQLAARTVQADLHNEQGEKMFDEASVPQDAGNMTKEDLVSKLSSPKMAIKLPAIESFIPVIFQRRYVDPALLIAKGDVEPFADTQEDLNDILNAKKDNIWYNVQNVAVIDSQSADSIPQLAQAKPGSIISVKGLSQSPNAFRWLEKPNMSQAADAEILRAKQSIRDTARIDQTSQGISNVANRTATEVNAQVAGAGAGFNTETRNLESGAYKQLGEMFLKMVQIFLTEPQLIRVVGKEGVEFKQFDPDKYWGDYDVKVQLESAAAAQQKMEGDQAIEIMKTFAGDPDFNQLELKKLALKKAFKMDDDEIELIMNSSPGNAAMAAGAPVGDPSMGTGAPQPGMPGSVPPPPPELPSPTAITNPDTGQIHESADLVKLYQMTADRPSVQDQIISLLGFDPGQDPPVSLVKTAQELSHNQDKHQMSIEQHTQSMSTPQETPVNG